MEGLVTWEEIYEHDEFGTIVITWDGAEPDRYHMIAMQTEFWTPAEEVAACLLWVRNLSEGKGYDPPREVETH